MDALAAHGHTINQATVSRALRRYGVRKIGGSYRPPRRRTSSLTPLLDLEVTAGGCLAVGLPLDGLNRWKLHACR